MLRLILPLLLLTGPALAEPVRIPAPGGAVLGLNAQQFNVQYNEWHYAPARIEGKLVYLSGVVAGAADGKPLDVAGFEASLRRAFGQIDRLLTAAGSDSSHIVEISSFHVFGAPLATFDKAAHLDAVRRVHAEFVKPPYPAWTAIGVSDLLPPGGMVEIRVLARLKD
ncbi:Rid family hydrolase [Massilia sp. TS11]|uniref:Rid family hydrolase n=1 Tax=Massilia sp. TS11 TaxID=2908003 RepID=UPI001EDC2D17|nr:Rid family hydrolase [Massilia sp. TS11]MCG2585396.1 Rid family hydrolase [Massilia sp. TS11]